MADSGIDNQEDELVAKLRQGDRTALEQLYQQNFGRLYSLVFHQVGREHASSGLEYQWRLISSSPNVLWKPSILPMDWGWPKGIRRWLMPNREQVCWKAVSFFPFRLTKAKPLSVTITWGGIPLFLTLTLFIRSSTTATWTIVLLPFGNRAVFAYWSTREITLKCYCHLAKLVLGYFCNTSTQHCNVIRLLWLWTMTARIL